MTPKCTAVTDWSFRVPHCVPDMRGVDDDARKAGAHGAELLLAGAWGNTGKPTGSGMVPAARAATIPPTWPSISSAAGRAWGFVDRHRIAKPLNAGGVPKGKDNPGSRGSRASLMAMTSADDLPAHGRWQQYSSQSRTPKAKISACLASLAPWSASGAVYVTVTLPLPLLTVLRP